MEKRKFKIVVAKFRVIVENADNVAYDMFDDASNIKVKQNGREFIITIKGETIDDCEKMFTYILKQWFINSYIRLAVEVGYYKSYDTYYVRTEHDLGW